MELLCCGGGWMFCGLIGAAIGARKGETIGGFVVGLIFGPFGVLFALLSSGDGKNAVCPSCKGRIPKKVTKCMHCGSDV